MVRKRGLEPLRDCSRQPLKLVRLPIPPLPRAVVVARLRFPARSTEPRTIAGPCVRGKPTGRRRRAALLLLRLAACRPGPWPARGRGHRGGAAALGLRRGCRGRNAGRRGRRASGRRRVGVADGLVGGLVRSWRGRRRPDAAHDRTRAARADDGQTERAQHEQAAKDGGCLRKDRRALTGTEAAWPPRRQTPRRYRHPCPAAAGPPAATADRRQRRW